MIVYCIRNLINGKLYVGKTVAGLRTRWSQHKYEAKAGSTHAIHNAIKKHGEESFYISIIARASTLEELNNLERAKILELGSHFSTGRGYNLTWGGDGPGSGPDHPGFGKKATVETRRKMSEARQGEKHHMYGKHHTEEARAKIKEARARQTMPKGIPKSIETRAKISATRKTQVTSEFRERQRQYALRGPETKLTIEQAREIRLLRGCFTQHELAEKFSVSQTTISLIWNNHRWKDAI